MEFESKSGVRYYFDNQIGIAFPSHPLIEKMIENVPLQKEDIIAVSEDDYLFYSNFVKKLDKIRPKKSSLHQFPIQAEEVKQQLLRDGLNQMTLGITEDCNLKCRYCVYSDAYTLSRKPSKQTMDFTTAKKALDYYASLIEEGRYYNPVRKPAVSFYGGEPLLHFDLIKECIHYLKTTYPQIDFIYSLTTNGTLLTKEKEEFLKKHEFLITVSIDGPKDEHDRKRIYPNGEGTFEDVMKNVRRFIAAGCENCSAICVFDWKSNLFDLDAFFSRTDVPKLSIISLPSVYGGCIYYDQFSEQDHKEFYISEENAFQYYLDHLAHDTDKHPFFEQLYPVFASRLMYTIPVLIMPDQRLIPYSGACIPGRKIFVDVHGNFHPCERINQFFPIGNVQTGLNFKRVAAIINDYNEHLDSCKTCPVSKACGYCYNHFAQKGNFDFASTVCKNEERIKKTELSRTFTLGENQSHLIDILVEGYYSWLSKACPIEGD
jgi:uncharacterized protein